MADVFTLTGEVRIEYKDYILTADKVAYDRTTGDAEADGHVQLQGKRNNELIIADHGKLNLDLETGRFENVTGSVGRQPSANKRKLVYTTANPFLFTGHVVIKEGPERYQIIEGTMTSCLLPDPDWRIHSSLIRVNYGEARAKNSYFTLLGVPILYLPYVTHPVNTETRESGLLIPVFGTSSTKGTIVGDSIYLVLNRSMDVTFGTQYFSKRGWSPSGDSAIAGEERILPLPALRLCSTGDCRPIISTRAGRTSSSVAGGTLTWTSTTGPSPPASISARMSIARHSPSHSRSPSPPR